MKILTTLIVMVILVGNTLAPPVGMCPDGQVWRCTMGMCTTTSVYCPPVFEDGKLVSEDCNNTSCEWDCSCVEKNDTYLYDDRVGLVVW